VTQDRRRRRRWLLLGGAGGGLLLLWGFFAGLVTADALRRLQQLGAHFAGEQPLATALLLALLLALTMALSLPAKAALNLLTGALLGPLAAGAVTLLGALAGTSVLFAVARHLLRSRAAAELGEQVARLQSRIERHPVLAIAGLRLMVTFPYAPITLAAALTRMRYRDFLMGSALGDLPVILLYSLAGARLATLRSLSDVLSPGTLLLLTLASLGLLAGALGGRWGRKAPVSQGQEGA